MSAIREFRPSWYTDEDDNAWQRVKAAFRRDWRQTKHDFGGKEPDLKQNVNDTIAQASGSKPIPSGNTPNRTDEMDDPYNATNEVAYRFGYAAYRHHGAGCEWDTDLETRLRKDWKNDADWQKHRAAVRHGWFYAKKQNCGDQPM